MPINWNGVNFAEACPSSPDFSIMPAQESRMTMRGWFNWADMEEQRASTAYLGTCQVRNNYTPRDQNGNILAELQPPDPGWNYFNYTNPYAHPKWPNGMFLADGFERVQGFIPNSPAIGPALTATFEEAETVIHFRSPRNGYRVLHDSLAIDPAIRLPREYYITRNHEVVEKNTARSQTIPPDAGLQWQFLGGTPNLNCSAANFITLHEGEVHLTWYPVPADAYNEVAMTNLIGKTNNATFPPVQGIIPGIPATPPRSLLSAKGGPKGYGTLVMGCPSKEVIRMGDCSWAYKIMISMRWFPYGANSFFLWNPPAGARGRIRIDPTDGPVQDATLGGPGYYRVARPDQSPLFPTADFRTGWMPAGMTF
jgi:hypothetical protein